MSTDRPSRLAMWWRQRRQPAAFRIGAPDWSGLALRWLEESAPSREPPEDRSADDDPHALVTAATNVWHARRRIARAESTKETRHLSKLLSATEQALGRLGVEVQDHDGVAFHAGFALDVIYQEDPTVHEETVTKTRRPTVYVHGRHVQTGEVVVAVPVDDGREESSHA